MVALFRSDTSTQKDGLWLVMQYAYRVKLFPRYVSASTGWNSTKLYGNLQYQEEMCISSPFSGLTL
jgi:hypothetical protein